MAKQTKKQQLVAKLDGEKIYTVDEALALAREGFTLGAQAGISRRHRDVARLLGGFVQPLLEELHQPGNLLEALLYWD